MLSTKTIRFISKTHEFIYRISKGRIGSRFGKLDFMLVTTMGRKTGKSRIVPLPIIMHNGDYLLVASFGGNDIHPSWLLNIRENPIVSIRIGSEIKSALATIVETADCGYLQLWKKVSSKYAGYNHYKKSTDRKIPIVVLRLCNG